MKEGIWSWKNESLWHLLLLLMKSACFWNCWIQGLKWCHCLNFGSAFSMLSSFSNKASFCCSPSSFKFTLSLQKDIPVGEGSFLPIGSTEVLGSGLIGWTLVMCHSWTNHWPWLEYIYRLSWGVCSQGWGMWSKGHWVEEVSPSKATVFFPQGYWVDGSRKENQVTAVTHCLRTFPPWNFYPEGILQVREVEARLAQEGRKLGQIMCSRLEKHWGYGYYFFPWW